MTSERKIQQRYKLHQAQLDFVKSKARYRAFIGGIGSGKTFVGCLEALRLAKKNAKSLGIVAAPTYPMLRDATIRTFFQICPQELISPDGWKRGDKELSLTNGSQILFRSASDPDSLRGPNLDWFFLDEGSILPTREAWDILIGRLRSAEKLNRGFVACTPKGMNYIYDVFIAAPTIDCATFHATTMDNKRNLDPDALNAIMSSYSGLFLKQEIYGEFVAFEGLVYPEFSIQKHLEFEEQDKYPRVIAGIDFGYTNPTALVVVALDNDERAYVLDEIYTKGQTIEQLLPEIIQKKERYNIESFYADPSSPDLISSMRNAGLKVREANNEILAGIMEISSRLIEQKDGRPRLYINKKCINTISEFQQYRYPEGKTGKNLDERPIKLFDHALDALRYALLTAKQSGKSSRFSNTIIMKREW